MIVSLYFKAELPLDAVRTLIAEARTNPAGVVAVDAALHVAGSLNAYRGDGGPFGSGSHQDCTIDELCDQVEAAIDGPQEGCGNLMFEAILAALVKKILSRFLPTL